MAMSAPTAYERAYEQLKTVLADLRGGEKLPPIRRLSENFQVSIPVISRALDRLRLDGEIEQRPRSGIYKTLIGGDELGRQELDILLFEPEDTMRPNNFISELFGFLAGRLANRFNFWNLHEAARRPQALAELFKHAPRLVFTYGIGIEHMEIFYRLRDAGIQVVNLLPNLLELPKPCVILDAEAVVRTQIAHLVDQGCRKIAYLHAVPDEVPRHRDQFLRYHAFYRLMHEFGLPLNPAWVRYAGFDMELLQRQTLALFGGAERPDALIIYDNYAHIIYAVLNQCHLQVGRDVAVIATDDMPWDSYLYPSLSSVCTARSAIADAVVDIWERFYADPGSLDKGMQLVIASSLTARESTLRT